MREVNKGTWVLENQDLIQEGDYYVRKLTGENIGKVGLFRIGQSIAHFYAQDDDHDIYFIFRGAVAKPRPMMRSVPLPLP